MTIPLITRLEEAGSPIGQNDQPGLAFSGAGELGELRTKT